MQFRLTKEHEIDRVMEILADGRESIASLGIDQWQGGYPFRSAIEDDVAQGKSYVVEDDKGSLIATAMIDFDGDVTYDRIEGAWLSSGTSENPDYVCVHRVAVAKEAKGKGAAKFILLQASSMGCQAGCLGVRIDTHPGNVPMRTLLEGCGFQYRGIIYIDHAGEDTPERVAFEKPL